MLLPVKMKKTGVLVSMLTETVNVTTSKDVIEPVEHVLVKPTVTTKSLKTIPSCLAPVPLPELYGPISQIKIRLR